MNQVLGSNATAQNFSFSGVDAVTAPATSSTVKKDSLYATFQLVSAAAATCVIEATNEEASANGQASNYVTLGTITLAGAGSDGFAANAAWKYVRARVTAATAATRVMMGV